MIQWRTLADTATVDAIADMSMQTPVLIFKHSTRCSISSMAKMRLEQDWTLSPEAVVPYYLDLITYRPVSQYIADKFSVWHESPQVLLISKGECVYDASHLDIQVAELEEELQATNS
jgi:bacillithiol system protein YtxJ